MRENFFFIHIPKTAGTSFRGILDDVYADKIITVDPGTFDSDLLGETPVQQGYVKYAELKHFNYSLVTFLREPIERVISHFYYIKSLHQPLYRSKETLHDFAERTGNWQTLYTGGDLSKFSFVGITEDFENEVERFAVWSGTKIDYSKYDKLKTGTNKESVSQEDREMIAGFCMKDIKLYNSATNKEK